MNLCPAMLRNNPRIPCHTREQGSVLLSKLIVSLVAGITLASYLVLISNRCRMSLRSDAWINALPVWESGIEEALMQLHDDYKTLNGNGWNAGAISGVSVNNEYRTNSDGSYSWAVLANPSSTNPVITSSGFIPVSSGKGYISRRVQVTTVRPVQFSQAGKIHYDARLAMVGNLIGSSWKEL